MKRQQTKRSVPCFKRWSRKNYGVFASLHRYVKIGVLSVAMSIILLASDIAGAQTADSTSLHKSVVLDAVGVTGRKQNPTRSAMTQTPIFDRGEQSSAPLQTIEAALRLSPSIDLRERGGKSTQADISIRGGSFDQTMVLLNGINFTDARTGHQTHSLPIDMDCVAGIELIDGMSGVGAFAGAVNIRTRPLKPRYLRLDLNGGEHGYLYTNLSGAVSRGRFSAFGSASYRRSDGYIHNTGFENRNAYVRMNYDSPRAGYFDFQAGYQNRRFGANGFYSRAFPDQYEHTETFLGSLRWLKSLGRFTLNSSVSYRKNYDRFELIHGDPHTVPYNYHNTDNIGAEIWVEYDSPAGTTALGGDYTFNHIFSTVLGDPLDTPHKKRGEKEVFYTYGKSRHVGNVWLRHAKQFRRFDLSGSLGVSSTPYGESLMWSLSGGYTPLSGLHIEAGATQSMRLPTFTDLYYTATGYVGNPDLKPERAITYRLHAAYDRGAWNASGTLYYRDGKNIIDWVRASDEALWESRQITRLDTYGIELAGRCRIGGFVEFVSANYGYISTDKHSGEQTSKYALDYMKHKGAASVGFRFLRRFTLVATGSVYDRNGAYTDNGETVSYPPYFLLDARLAWEKGKIKIYSDMTNITSTDYCDFGGLRMPGFWVVGGLTLTL
ncbi:MAG: TonB-dependent receptor [Rikenellaceae bacterium]|nr:TonB-dependent receptor [Rikenellaceae bacterium]